MSKGLLRKFMFRLTTILVVVFWLVMMGLLIKREMPALEASNIFSRKEAFLPPDLVSRDEWMGVYYQKTKIGYSHTWMEATTKKDFAGYKISNSTLLALSFLGEERRLLLQGNALVDEDFLLKDFHFSLDSRAHHLRVKGELKKDVLWLDIYSGQSKSTAQIPIKEKISLYHLLSPRLSLERLTVGQPITMNIFDPLLLNVGQVTIIPKGWEEIEVGGTVKRGFKVESNYQGMSSYAWIDDKGELLREESPLGWVMVKEGFAKVMAFPEIASSASLDILSTFSIPVDLDIPRPRQLKFLKIETRGVDLSSFHLSTERQRVTERDGWVIEILAKEVSSLPVLSLPIKEEGFQQFLKATPFIQSDHPQIVRQARQIIAGKVEPWVAAREIGKWVSTHIRPTFTLSIPSALDVLHTKEGDCNEYTVLFTALARAVGIPTRMVSGIVYYNGQFFYHAWPKVFVGEWISMDPALNQEIADATHIQLVEGGPQQQAKIAKLFKNLKIRVIGYE